MSTRHELLCAQSRRCDDPRSRLTDRMVWDWSRQQTGGSPSASGLGQSRGSGAGLLCTPASHRCPETSSCRSKTCIHDEFTIGRWAEAQDRPMAPARSGCRCQSAPSPQPRRPIIIAVYWLDRIRLTAAGTTPSVKQSTAVSCW